jgi:hypothetical protein
MPVTANPPDDLADDSRLPEPVGEPATREGDG